MIRWLAPTGSRSATFGCLLLGGLLAVVSTAQGWWRATGGGSAVVFTGTEATGGLSQALAVVALAGTLLVLVLRVRGRRIVAVLLALDGFGITGVGVLRLAPGGEAVRARMRQVSLADTYALSSTSWPWVYAVGGVLVLAGAALLWQGAPHWVARPDRFDRSARRDLPGATGPARPTTADAADDPAGVWRALDAGLDPTAEEDDPDSRSAAHPNAPEPGLRGHNGTGEAPMRERGA